MKGEEWYRDEETAESYDPKRFSGAGGEHINSSERESVREVLGDVEGKKILDVASGTGRFSLLAAEMGADVVSCDISKPMLKIAREKASEKGLESKITFLKTDAENLPFEDETFDIVMAIRFVHLMVEEKPFLEEMKRVSRDRLVFDTFNLSSFRILYNFALPMQSHLYTKKDIEDVAEDLGLTVESRIHDFVIPFGFYRHMPDLSAGFLKWIDRGAQKRRFWKKLASVTYWSLSKE
ncbi:MAG: class I SAM-dependent methyltransferase [Candidatus Aenigmatarchaeota archaeon]